MMRYKRKVREMATTAPVLEGRFGRRNGTYIIVSVIDCKIRNSHHLVQCFQKVLVLLFWLLPRILPFLTFLTTTTTTRMTIGEYDPNPTRRFNTVAVAFAFQKSSTFSVLHHIHSKQQQRKGVLCKLNPSFVNIINNGVYRRQNGIKISITRRCSKINDDNNVLPLTFIDQPRQKKQQPQIDSIFQIVFKDMTNGFLRQTEEIGQQFSSNTLLPSALIIVATTLLFTNNPLNAFADEAITISTLPTTTIEVVMPASTALAATSNSRSMINEFSFVTSDGAPATAAPKPPVAPAAPKPPAAPAAAPKPPAAPAPAAGAPKPPGGAPAAAPKAPAKKDTTVASKVLKLDKKCPSFDKFYQLTVQRRLLQMNPARGTTYENDGIKFVRNGLCNVESYYNEPYYTKTRFEYKKWFLPSRETIVTYRTGVAFAIVVTLIGLLTSKIIALMATYFDFILGFPSRRLGQYGLDKIQYGDDIYTIEEMEYKRQQLRRQVRSFVNVLRDRGDRFMRERSRRRDSIDGRGGGFFGNNDFDRQRDIDDFYLSRERQQFYDEEELYERQRRFEIERYEDEEDYYKSQDAINDKIIRQQRRQEVGFDIFDATEQELVVLALSGLLINFGEFLGFVRYVVERFDLFVGRYALLVLTGYIFLKTIHLQLFPNFPANIIELFYGK